MPTFPPYPIFLTLRGQHVLVVGGGAVALRKAQSLLASGAKITVVSPAMHLDFKTLDGVTRIQAGYKASDMTSKKWRLVFAATNVSSVNARVQKDAALAGVLCCRCDDPAKGQFTSASTGRVGPITFAVSTAGAAPALAVRVRDHAVANVDPVLVALADLNATWRHQIQAAIGSSAARKAILRQLAGEEMESCLRRKGRAGAQRLFKRWFAASLKQSASTPSRATAHA